MSEQSSNTKKLQWKWVGITLLLYVVFYPAPVVIAYYLLTQKAVQIFIGMWLFAGIIIIGAVAGYLSEGVTLWEPAIAAAGFIVLFFLGAMAMMVMMGGGLAGLTLFQSVMQIVITIVIFFFFSLLGAWIGERAQKLWRSKIPQ
ncbi:MAG: hypothetical protein NTX44_06530 [Ignavibacteriales bacterium]|nr:hypothetical protein [Ignavibacteriales bacterium]